MHDEVKAFFEAVARRGYDARLRGASGTCEFAFDDDGAWRVTNADGWVTVREGHGEADTAIAGGMGDFLAAVRGERHPWTLEMQGIMRITGDWALAQVVSRLFPAPDVLPDHRARPLSSGPLNGGTDQVQQDRHHA
jgi:hypothetical protein